MGIISWIILGVIAGFVGGKIVNREGQGFWLNIALGIIGALAGLIPALRAARLSPTKALWSL